MRNSGDGTSSSFSSPLPPCPEDLPAPPPPSCTPPQYQPQEEDGNTECGDDVDDDRASSSMQRGLRSSASPRDDESADADTEDLLDAVQDEEDEHHKRNVGGHSPSPPPPSPPSVGETRAMGTPPPPPPPPFSPPSHNVPTSFSGDISNATTTDEDHSQGSRASQEVPMPLSVSSGASASVIASMRAAASNKEIIGYGTTVQDTPTDKPRFYIGDIESYTIIDKVGSGTYGEVFKCQHKVTKDIVALKKLRADVEKNGFPVTSIREMKILKQLKHPNIVMLKEIVSSSAPPKEGKRPPLYFAFEYLEHDLCGLLNHPKVKFSRTQIQCYMRQLLCGVAFMHRNKIVHRDIKASNLLLNNQGMLKIADFGLSRFWNDVAAKAGRYTNKVVTLWYRSPELLLGSTSYDFSVDVWSVGCIFAELLVGRPILQGKTEVDQLKLVFGLVGMPTEETWPGFSKLPGAKDIVLEEKYFCPLQERFKNFPQHAVDLLQKLLTLDPAKRITAAEAMDHDYFWRVVTCKPRDLPKFSVSSTHEYQSKKRHHGEMAAAAAAKQQGADQRNVRQRDRHYRGAEHPPRSHHGEKGVPSHASSQHHESSGHHRGDRGRPHYHDRDRDRERDRSRSRDRHDPRERDRSRERDSRHHGHHHHRSRHDER